MEKIMIKKKFQNPELDWKHAAESDFVALMTLSKAGAEVNAIGFLSQQCIEKYMKHILCKVSGISKEEVNNLKFKNGRGKLAPCKHNMTTLCKQLYQNYGIEVPSEQRERLKRIGDLFYQTRYPDVKGYHDITAEEISECVDAVVAARGWCFEKEALIEMAEKEDEQERI